MIWTGFLTSPLAPLADAVSDAYNINISTINLSSSLFSFACLITGIPANFLIIKLGVRNTTIIANLLFVAGNVLKLFVNENIYFVHAG
jgi:fucose permease